MKAIVIGATGLVGKIIVDELIKNSQFDSVLVFARSTTGLKDPKLTERLISFEKIDEWKKEIQGDVLFSALGTTLKTAGSKDAQYRIDHDYQYKVAWAAADNGVQGYVLISSVNANPKSPFFYLKMKGELDNEVSCLGFKSISILRPGPLHGHRKGPRKREIIATSVLNLMPKALLSAGMTPVPAETVARAAIKWGLKGEEGVHIVEAKDIFKY